MGRCPEQQEGIKGETKWSHPLSQTGWGTNTATVHHWYQGAQAPCVWKCSQGEATARPWLKTEIQRKQVLEFNSHHSDVNRGSWLGFLILRWPVPTQWHSLALHSFLLNPHNHSLYCNTHYKLYMSCNFSLAGEMLNHQCWIHRCQRTTLLYETVIGKKKKKRERRQTISIHSKNIYWPSSMFQTLGTHSWTDIK